MTLMTFNDSLYLCKGEVVSSYVKTTTEHNYVSVLISKLRKMTVIQIGHSKQ